MKRRAAPPALLARLFPLVQVAAFALLSVSIAAPLAALAQADADVDEADLAAAESLRAEVASEIQLVAMGLLDELVFQWTGAPPFEAPTPLVVGGLSVPLGLGTGLGAILENHLYDLLLSNPRARLTPVHCPACTGLVVQSKPKGTLLARGFELPGVLPSLLPNPRVKHALFLDFEAEGATLVLRAKVTSLEAGLPIVSAKTISTSSSSPALLRDPRALKSASDTRKEYVDILAGRDRFYFPLRAIARVYASPSGGAPISPFVWFEAGAETFFTQEEQWGGGMAVGITSLRGVHEGWSAGARVVRLVSGASRSLTRPDVYLVAGGAVLDIRGENARAFQRSPTPQADVLRETEGKEPRATVPTWRLGSELRIKNRFSAGLFGEAVPTADGRKIGSYVDFGAMSIRAVGLEVGLWF